MKIRACKLVFDTDEELLNKITILGTNKANALATAKDISDEDIIDGDFEDFEIDLPDEIIDFLL